MAEPLRYRIDLRHRRQHLVTVSLQVPDDLPRPVRLVMPTWTAGSYVMRDYVHHLQRIDAVDAEGTAVRLGPDGHTGWLLDRGGAHGVVVTWELYANDLTVRTNHVDDHHALLVAPATFVVVEEARHRPHEVHVHTDEPVWSLLPAADDPGRFVASDLDHLLDSAIEVGDFPSVEVEATVGRGHRRVRVPHRFVWAGHGGRPDLDRMGADVVALAETAVELFDGELPVEAYTFLCVGWDRGGGGLEHRDGSVLMIPVTAFQDDDTYAKLQSLVAHEYLHLWNVKRLVPSELVAPDPVAHTHTRLLWVAEGWTAYYDDLLPLRAGLWTTRRFLDDMATQLDRVLERPGTRLQSVEEASYHAWTKQYVRDENSENVGTDYYAHGAVLAWCLDLLVRRDRPESDGLDTAVRDLWHRFGGTGTGYTDEDVRTAVSGAAGTDLGWFFDAHVAGRELPPVEDLVDVVGLTVERPEPDQPTPSIGATVVEDAGRVTISAVHRDGPAWTGGVTGGDELVAVDGHAVGPGRLPAILRGHDPGDEVVLTVTRGPRRLDLPVVLDPPFRPRRLCPVADPSDAQRVAFARWTGTELPDRGRGEGDGS